MLLEVVSMKQVICNLLLRKMDKPEDLVAIFQRDNFLQMGIQLPSTWKL